MSIDHPPSEPNPITDQTIDTEAWAGRDFLNKQYPAGVQWDIEIPHANIATLVEEAAQKFGKKPCMNFMGKTFTYAEFNDMVNKSAKGLAEKGVKKGDRVGLYMPNSPYYPVMFFAAAKVGATLVNLSPSLSLDQLEEQIKDSGLTTMVALDLNPFYDNARILQKKGLFKTMIKCRFDNMMPFFKKWGFRVLDSLKAIFNTPLRSSDRANETENVFTFRKLQKGQSDNNVFTTTVDADNDVAVLQYTGGTTGSPKAAMLTHFNLMANVTQIQELYSLTNSEKDPHHGIYLEPGKEKVLAVLPYFHVFGMMVGMIYALKAGAEIVMVPNPRDYKSVLKTIDKQKPTIVPAIPQLLQKLVEFKGFEKYDMSSIRGVVSGGAALPPGVQKAFEDAVGKKGLIKQGYGLTETSPLAAVNPPSGANRPETVGLGCPGTDIRIADPNDISKTMEIGEKGEIVIRGPQVMKGYFNKPEATAEAIQDGWFLTGDLGVMSEDGYVQIVDRKKRMIIVNGNNVYPNQIENALSQHPDIAECVIIKVSDERSGEAGKAFIRLNEGVNPMEESIRGFLLQHLKPYEIPKHIEFVTEDILKTAVGKPDWKTLEDMEKVKKDGTAQPAPAAPEPAPTSSTPASPKP